MTDRKQKILALGLVAGLLALVMIFIAGVAVGVARVVENKKADEQVLSELLEFQKRALAKTKDGLPVADEDLDAMLATLRTHADRANGSEAPFYRCGAEVIAAQARGGRALQRKLAELDTLLIAKDADRDAEIDRRLRVLGEFEVLNRLAIARLERMPSDAERCLAKNRVNEKMKKAYLAGVNRTPSARSTQLEIRRVDVDFVAAARDDLMWLRSAQPRFHYDAAQDALVFDTDADLRVYQGHLARLEEISARSEKAGQSFISAVESGIARKWGP